MEIVSLCSSPRKTSVSQASGVIAVMLADHRLHIADHVCHVPQASGVIAVVVFGLYGNMTSKWGMLASTEESGAFDAVWDTISFAVNGVVFFWSGVSSINFLIRRGWFSHPAVVCAFLYFMHIPACRTDTDCRKLCICASTTTASTTASSYAGIPSSLLRHLQREPIFCRSTTIASTTAWSYAGIPLVYVFMFLVRGLCITLFNPLFRFAGEMLSWRQILFVTWSGLRGSVSLILISDIMEHVHFNPGEQQLVASQVGLCGRHAHGQVIHRMHGHWEWWGVKNWFHCSGVISW